MTSLPVQEKTLLNISTAVYTQLKADVQNVRRSCRGKHDHAVEWLSSRVPASRGPPKCEQHADEQLSPLVMSLRLDTPAPGYGPIGKKSNGARSGERGSHRTGPPYNHRTGSSGRVTPYPANHVQEHRNAPEPHHAR